MIQMDRYEPKEITAEAKEAASAYPGLSLPDNPNASLETAFSMAAACDALEKVTGTRRDHFSKVTIAQQGESGRVIQYQFDDLKVGAAALRLACLLYTSSQAPRGILQKYGMVRQNSKPR